MLISGSYMEEIDSCWERVPRTTPRKFQEKVHTWHWLSTRWREEERKEGVQDFAGGIWVLLAIMRTKTKQGRKQQLYGWFAVDQKELEALSVIQGDWTSKLYQGRMELARDLGKKQVQGRKVGKVLMVVSGSFSSNNFPKWMENSIKCSFWNSNGERKITSDGVFKSKSMPMALKCSSQTSSINITWELIYVKCGAPHRTY